MRRTTVMLPEELAKRAQRAGWQTGMSMGGVVREALETYLGDRRTDAREPGAPTGDSLLDDDAVFDGGPTDLAARHDAYLYDEDA